MKDRVIQSMIVMMKMRRWVITIYYIEKPEREKERDKILS